jgi:hypothetical protein
MKIQTIIFLFLVNIAFMNTKAMAQTGPATAPVMYEVIYNTSTCLYEAHAHVMSGSLGFPFTIPFPSNFTIVIPQSFANSPIAATSYQPPSLSWTNSNNVYSPAADPLHDFHMFSISGGGAGQTYSTFSAGDDILLFTFSIPHSSCEEGIRVFINGTDPDSGAPGMNGLDLSNSLKTFDATGTYPQGIEQYDANLNNGGVILPKPTSNPSFDCSGSTIDLFANTVTPYPSCLGPLAYEWTGPNGYFSTDVNPSITVTDPAAQSGQYSLLVTDDNGCFYEGNIDITDINCLILPVELLSFDATKKQDDVLLNWITATEINNDYFEIQRSTDGDKFTTIGMVNGTGTTFTETKYSFIDDVPGRSNYYRLKQVDFDGKSEFSDLRFISFEQDNSSHYYAYPNPFTNKISLSLKEGVYKVSLYNIHGELVLNTSHTAGQEIIIPELPTGTYLIRAEDALGVKVLEQVIIKS